MKRTLDIIASFIGLLVLAPFLLCIIILLKITDPGPAFYRQKRVGCNRKEFELIKFRSMVVNADKKGLEVTSKHDSRITPVGRVLRRTKLDELPELWNVLIGEMSLVGPRPETPKYVAKFKPEWLNIYNNRPGITDLATLHFRDEESVLAHAKDTDQAYMQVVLPIKVRLAMDYEKNKSFVFDLQILVLTLWSITFGRIFVKPDDSLAQEAIAEIKKLDL